MQGVETIAHIEVWTKVRLGGAYGGIYRVISRRTYAGPC